MNERGNSRTAGTDWQLMDVNSMWACLQDHDTANHWKQVAGWRKVCDLAQIHLGRLQEYRRGLATAWPPETSAASRTYLAQLDELIDKVRHTHDAAAANYTALSAATQAIGTTRAALRKIYEEYADKLQQKQAYETTAANPKAIMGSRVTEPPVTDAELERLNVQARGMMFGLSGELQQAQATLQKPPAVPKSPRQPDNPDVYGDYTAPIIPPVLPVPALMAPAVRRGSASGGGLGPVPTTPGVGPVLGGAAGGVSAPPNVAALPVAQPPGSAGSAHNIALGLTSGMLSPPSGLPSTPPRTIQPGTPNSPVGGGADGNAKPHASPARPAPSAGGLIGGIPGVGPNQPSNNAVAPKRVNPIGGVIGGGGAGTAPTGAAGTRPGTGRNLIGTPSSFPIGGAPGHHGTTPRLGTPSQVEDPPSRWDPDNPWETDQGVPPVVLPPKGDGPIDPGPAIGFSK
ncbi:hypothetical protein FHG89_15385 [Micromonospora orduensis]|uniref:PPE domain-containing protein n=1 Tax=Micromonospora orduensis TaxID=1420891 RepID=A0A5C4QMU5_9ACTN|nr:hypothetical protein [Micromonospora orduensis]TNH28345.1 hypothetical protein FHG89_15385 [Micromonospora orduensis]